MRLNLGRGVAAIAVALCASAAWAGTAAASEDIPTTTAVTSISPNPAYGGQDVTYTVKVEPQDVIPAGAEPVPGTVNLSVDGVTPAGCANLPLDVDWTATCTAPAPGAEDTYEVFAEYSGGDGYGSSHGLGSLTVVNRVTTTSVSASPDPVITNGQLTLTASVSSVGGMPTGTVKFELGGSVVTGCESKPLTAGVATCVTSAPAWSTSPSVKAIYNGEAGFAGSDNTTSVRVLDQASIVGSVSPNPVQRSSYVVYTATVSGIMIASGDASAAEIDFGTVAFTVDGQPVGACQEQPLDWLTMTATCVAIAPPVGGQHTLKVDYSGNYWATTATHSGPFQVLAPGITLPSAVDFGSIEVGKTNTRTITLLNSGTTSLKVGSAAVSGPFTIAADECSGKKIGAGHPCDIQVTFTPGGVGAQTGALVVKTDGEIGDRTVALTGTGVAAPVPPVTTVTPPPAPPAPGGKFAPGKPTVLTVSPPPASKPGTAPTLSVPLSCPANEECDLSGQLTISTSALAKTARAAAAGKTTVARFSGVQVKAGGLKTVKLKLSPSFIKKAQKRGIRRVKATLTITTVFGNGQRATTRQQVTVVIPKAAKRKPAAAKVAPRFTG